MIIKPRINSLGILSLKVNTELKNKFKDKYKTAKFVFIQLCLLILSYFHYIIFNRNALYKNPNVIPGFTPVDKYVSITLNFPPNKAPNKVSIPSILPNPI